MINPLKFFVALLTAIVSLAIAIAMLYLHHYVPALIFIAISVTFFITSSYSGARIEVNRDSVTRISIFRKRTTFSWSEIKEVGVAGSKIFLKGERNKPGTLYIYFSKKELNDDERFDMMLKWPPKDVLYLEYTDTIAKYILPFWGRPFVEYNTGNEQIIK